MSCSFRIGDVEIPVKDIFIYPQSGIQMTREGFANVVSKLKLTTVLFPRDNEKYPFAAEAQINMQRIYSISDTPYFEFGYHELMAVQEK